MEKQNKLPSNAAWAVLQHYINAHELTQTESAIFVSLTLLHSERPKLYGGLAVLSAIELKCPVLAKNLNSESI